ncbi:MAG: FAD binding domain-containing protein, partial [Spirochaetes bacterium]|nr:FAD binding domain-containing protein [Spirochaetota bacterium]
MVKEYFKPTDVEEALGLLSAPGALALAGGTWALAFEGRDKPERVVDLGAALPRSIERRGEATRIGAYATFQEIIESAAAPAVVKAAAASMANRNTRNRATIGGNLGANKSCASLVPVLLALGASVESKARGKPSATMPLADWLSRPEGLVLTV